MKSLFQTNEEICLVCLNQIEQFQLRKIFESTMYCCNECLHKLSPNIRKLNINEIQGYGIYSYTGMIKTLIYQSDFFYLKRLKTTQKGGFPYYSLLTTKTSPKISAVS